MILSNTVMLGPRMERALRAGQGASICLFAQAISFFKQEHRSPSGSKQERTDVLSTTILGPLRI